jgi:hypothetical protein
MREAGIAVRWSGRSNMKKEVVDVIGGGCGSKVEVFVLSGWHGKMVTYRCGNTGIDGFPVLCGKCAKGFDRSEFRRQVEECGERIEDDY